MNSVRTSTEIEIIKKNQLEMKNTITEMNTLDGKNAQRIE